MDLPELFLRLSPRDSIRVDTRAGDGTWRHKYVSQPRPSVPPSAPYAVHLSDEQRPFQWVAFDLDSKKGDTGPDLATLLRWLEEAGLRYVVAASGSAGGRHVWVTAAELLQAHLVGFIAASARRRLPTLDHGLLMNARTGAVRPIGAPHRHGGRSQLHVPADPRRAAALLTPQTCGNDSEAFVRLAAIIGAVPAPAEIRPRPSAKPAATRCCTTSWGRAYRHPGDVLDTETMALLSRKPSADRVSETLASLFTNWPTGGGPGPWWPGCSTSDDTARRTAARLHRQRPGELRRVLSERRPARRRTASGRGASGSPPRSR